MKRIILFLLALSMIHTAQAQVGIYKSRGFGAIKKEKKQRVKRTYEWENMILLNYAFTTTGKTHNVGFTYARCKEAGFYVDAMVGTEWHFANTDGYAYNRFVTNKTSHPRISFGGGAIVRMVIPLYVYAGAGYAYRELNYKTYSGDQWAKYDDNPCHYADVECGLIGSIKGFTIQAGYSLLARGGYGNQIAHEIKVGLGYTFPDKKKGGQP